MCENQCNINNNMQHNRAFIADSFHSLSKPISISLYDKYTTSEPNFEENKAVKQLSKRG